jgi:hypothetical protein
VKGITVSDRQIVTKIGRRLRLVLHSESGPPVEDAQLLPPHPPEIEFVAYTEDCRLVGHIRMDAGRLTDLLNQHDEYELIDVQVEDLTGDRAVEAKEVVVTRDELLLVHAAGPRGDRGRRVRTRQHPLAMQVGPYRIRGYLHALPGVDPIASLRHRNAMVPLTDAWVEYGQGAAQQRRRVATLVVNRHNIDWVVQAKDDEVEMPDVPLQFDNGPMLKDFTGQVLGGPARRG